MSRASAQPLLLLVLLELTSAFSFKLNSEAPAALLLSSNAVSAQPTAFLQPCNPLQMRLNPSALLPKHFLCPSVPPSLSIKGRTTGVMGMRSDCLGSEGPESKRTERLRGWGRKGQGTEGLKRFKGGLRSRGANWPRGRGVEGVKGLELGGQEHFEIEEKRKSLLNSLRCKLCRGKKLCRCRDCSGKGHLVRKSRPLRSSRSPLTTGELLAFDPRTSLPRAVTVENCLSCQPPHSGMVPCPLCAMDAESSGFGGLENKKDNSDEDPPFRYCGGRR